jgi:uncharacterized repeat protein (TIGR01451 family)
MRSEESTITIRTYGVLAACILLAMAGAGSDVVQARSLYTVSGDSGEPSPIAAYDIAPDGTLTFQTQTLLPYGAVGLAADWTSGALFVACETSDALQLFDAQTMADIGRINAMGTEDLAAIVYDPTKDLLYAIDHGIEMLRIFAWSPGTGQLIPTFESPMALDGSTIHRIDLDAEGGLLYAADGSRTIRAYDASDGSVVRTICLDHPATCVAVDVANRLLYTGAGSLADLHLRQYDMSTGENRAVPIDAEAGVTGIAVDPVTGLVYVTSGPGRQSGQPRLLCYDATLTLIDSIPAVGRPTHILVATENVGYNPLRFAKSIVSDPEAKAGQDVHVGVGEPITYRLSIENLNPLREVQIVDSLPKEVTFIGAEKDGDIGAYDPVKHAYTWRLPSIAAGTQTCLRLRTRVNPQVPIGTRMRNHATIWAESVPPSSASVDALVQGGDWQPLRLSKQVVGAILCGDDVPCVNVGGQVSYAICYSNEDNDAPVTDVSIIDTLPVELTLLGVEGAPDSASYDAANHAYTWTFASLAPRASGRIILTAHIAADVSDGTVLTNSVALLSNETPSTTATTDVIVRRTELKPLIVTKQVTAGGTESEEDRVRYVDAGELITYTLCCDNRDNNDAVENVTIVDFLGEHMTFVSAEGNDRYGRYDPITHTYAWSIPSLAARQSICLELVAQVKGSTPTGTVIVNRATADSDRAKAGTDQAVVVVKPIDRNAVGVIKSITTGAMLGDDDKMQYVGIGTEITYQICLHNSDAYRRVDRLSIVDVLPAEVAFVTADADGVLGSYNRDRHVYTWTYPSLLPDSTACVALVVQVREDTALGAIVTNRVTIDSDDTDPRTAVVTAVAAQAKPKPLDLTKTITGGVQGFDERGTAYVALGQEITYTICVRNDNREAATNVIVADNLPAETTFVAADGDGDIGSYDRAGHKYTWSYPTLAPGQRRCVRLTVRVSDDVRRGSTIVNRVQAQSDRTAATVTDMHVVTEWEPPLLSKAVRTADGVKLTGTDRPCVHPGEEVTYEICIENPNETAISGVIVADALPEGAAFIRAASDGPSGQYDPVSHTCTWSYSTLEPGVVRCMTLTVKLNYDLEPERVVLNTVSLDAIETPVANAAAEVCIGEAPLNVTLTLSPLILGRTGYNRSDRITALLEFPPHVKESDIDPKTLLLDPGNVPADSQTLTITNGTVQIRATFDLGQVLDAIPDNGITTLYVSGRLRSQHAFFGKSTVLVVARRPY